MRDKTVSRACWPLREAWWIRALRLMVCAHPEVRCVHGDEAIALSFKRSVCVACGKRFDQLPTMCWYTGVEHRSTNADQ